MVWLEKTYFWQLKYCLVALTRVGVPPHWAALWVPCGCICTTTCITLYTLHYASLCTVHLSVHCAVHHCVHCALCITVHCVQNCVLATLSAPWRKKLTHSLGTCAAPLYAPSLLLLLQFHGFQREVWLDWPTMLRLLSKLCTYLLQGCCFERNHAWSGLSDKWVTDGQRVELGMTAATINWTHNWPPWATLCTTGAKSLKTSANNFGQQSKLILHSILSIWIILGELCHELWLMIDLLSDSEQTFACFLLTKKEEEQYSLCPWNILSISALSTSRR